MVLGDGHWRNEVANASGCLFIHFHLWRSTPLNFGSHCPSLLSLFVPSSSALAVRPPPMWFVMPAIPQQVRRGAKTTSCVRMTYAPDRFLSLPFALTCLAPDVAQVRTLRVRACPRQSDQLLVSLRRQAAGLDAEGGPRGPYACDADGFACFAFDSQAFDNGSALPSQSAHECRAHSPSTLRPPRPTSYS